MNDPSFQPDVPWRAAYRATLDTGYLLMAPSASQLTFHYVNSDRGDHGHVVDSFTIVRK